MHQVQITVETPGRGCLDITRQVQAVVRDSGKRNGLCHVFLKHTSASLMLCENADPDVLRDMEAFMSRLAPDGDPLFTHVDEGPDDMPSHVRTILTHSDLTLPVLGGQCDLGTWQGVFLWEHRRAPHRRILTITIS